MLQAIINFFRNLFGSNKDSGGGNKQLSQQNAGQQQQNAGQQQQQAPQAHGAVERLSLVDGDIIRRVDGAALVRDEDDGEILWHSEVNLELTPEQYVDDWGPLGGPDDLDKFMFHETDINMAMQGDADDAERKCQEFGYADMGQFYRVRGTMLKHKGSRGGAYTIDEYVFASEDVMRAAMGGGHLRQAAQSEAALAANPELLAPVDGVDLDTYAMLAATTASGMGQDEFNALLAQHNLDPAKWVAINAEWSDRMAKDTSMAIVTAYGKAFGAAGQGQYGAAGQAGAAAMGSVGAAGGEEPVSFDRYCEIAGAQTAWSNSGQDVNAMLMQVFQIRALDWSTMSMWWMAKMQAEPSMFQKHSELSEKYEKQYGGGGMAGADDDLAF